MENFDPTVAYDIVQLPSHGIHYPNNKKSVKVAYLTAADENILTSPNLVQNDLVVDELLKRKILDKDIDIDILAEEDRQAVLIFLRNTAFGTEYKLILTDPKTNKDFEVTIDLATLKIKDFDLVQNSNGEFEYHLPITKKTVTFKFLTPKQERELEQLKTGVTGTQVVPYNTKKLEMMIKSVDGNSDQMAIYQFIQKLPIKDSQDFKNFVNKNKPGLDLVQQVTTPSGEKVFARVDFGVEFFRPFFGL
jgi:hypothetical protein